MPILKNVLGLDLGTHTLKAIELQQGLRSLDAVRMHAEPREPDVPLAEQLGSMLHVHGFQREYAVTAVRGDRVSVRRLSFPFTEKRRLAQAVPFEVDDLVPFEIEDMVLDWEVVGRERNRSEVLTSLAPRATVSELIETLHEAGCDARVIEGEGLVLSNLCRAFELPGARLVVDLGHSKTTLCALVDGVAIGARSVSVAGRALSEAVATDRLLSPEAAERYKHEYGLLAPGQNEVMPSAAALLDRLGSEILRFTTSLEPQRPGGFEAITLLGGSAQLEHIDTWIAERVGIPTERLGLPNEAAGLGLVAGGSPLVFGPAAALALRGTARATTQVNLRQDDFARRTDLSWLRRDFGGTGILAAIVAVLALISFSTGAVLESSAAGSVEEQIQSLYSEAFPDQPLPDDPIATMRSAVREANERAEFLGVYRGNLSALDVLTEISRRVPESLDVAFEELSIDKQTVRVRVTAKSFEAADRLGKELSRFGPFDQARIGAIETDKRTGGKKFTVTIGLGGSAEGGR